MVKIKPPFAHGQTPSLKGLGVMYARNGQVILRAAPRKKKRPLPLITQLQNEDFALMNKVAKYSPGVLWQYAHVLTRDSPWYPRDLLVSHLYGRVFDEIQWTGGKLVSMAARFDISEDLDILGPAGGGAALVKRNGLWVPVTPNAQGLVLTAVTVEGQLTADWEAPAGGGGAWSVIFDGALDTGVPFHNVAGCIPYQEFLVIARDMTCNENQNRNLVFETDGGETRWNASGDYKAIAPTGIETNFAAAMTTSTNATAARSIWAHIIGSNGETNALVINQQDARVFAGTTDKISNITIGVGGSGLITGGSATVLGR